jgi:hypothetical protein
LRGGGGKEVEDVGAVGDALGAGEVDGGVEHAGRIRRAGLRGNGNVFWGKGALGSLQLGGAEGERGRGRGARG